MVTDGHAYGRNILIEELDPRALLNSGTPSPLSMVEGVDTGVDGVMFVGYHARIGTPQAILEHTWSDERVAQFSLRWGNQTEFQPIGEIGLNAAICGHFGVPVVMISGDKAACSEAVNLLGKVDTAVVKVASGRMAAMCYPPEESQQKIQQAAYQAVSRLAARQDNGDSVKPLVLKPPITMAIDFVQSEMADKAAMLPGTQRTGRRIEYTASDILTIFQAFRTAIALAK